MKFPLPSSVRDLLSTRTGRKALFNSGAAIAALYFGHVSGEAALALHEALTVHLASFPCENARDCATALHDGARFHAAAALQAVGDWMVSAGHKLTDGVATAYEASRHFLGRGVGQAKGFFVEHAELYGEKARNLCNRIAEKGPEVLARSRELFEDGISLVRAAAEAWGIYELGRRAWRKILDVRSCLGPTEGKGETPAAHAEGRSRAPTDVEVSVAIAGAPAAQAADRALGSAPADDPRRILRESGVLWMSDQLRAGVADIRIDGARFDIPGAARRDEVFDGRNMRLENLEIRPETCRPFESSEGVQRLRMLRGRVGTGTLQPIDLGRSGCPLEDRVNESAGPEL